MSVLLTLDRTGDLFAAFGQRRYQSTLTIIF